MVHAFLSKVADLQLDIDWILERWLGSLRDSSLRPRVAMVVWNGWESVRWLYSEDNGFDLSMLAVIAIFRRVELLTDVEIPGRRRVFGQRFIIQTASGLRRQRPSNEFGL